MEELTPFNKKAEEMLPRLEMLQRVLTFPNELKIQQQEFLRKYLIYAGEELQACFASGVTTGLLYDWKENNQIFCEQLALIQEHLRNLMESMQGVKALGGDTSAYSAISQKEVNESAKTANKEMSEMLAQVKIKHTRKRIG